MRAEGLHDPLPQFHRGDGRAGPERASRGYCCCGEHQRLILGPCSCRGPISRDGANYLLLLQLRHMHCRGQNHGEAAGRTAPAGERLLTPTTKLYDRHTDGTSLDEYEQIEI